VIDLDADLDRVVAGLRAHVEPGACTPSFITTPEETARESREEPLRAALTVGRVTHWIDRKVDVVCMPHWLEYRELSRLEWIERERIKKLGIKPLFVNDASLVTRAACGERARTAGELARVAAGASESHTSNQASEGSNG
jgi:hypothetical protein